MKILNKKNIVLALSFLFAFMIVSCDDFLDVPATGSYNDESVFINENRAEMAVLGCYNAIRNQAIASTMNMGTDEADNKESVSGTNRTVSSYGQNPARSMSLDWIYLNISKCNYCIKGIPGMSAFSNSDKLKKMYGEVLTIRALQYLDLIRYWGDVPYITLPQSDYNTVYSSRVSRDVIYDGIIKDLQTAIELVPWSDGGSNANSNERITKQAVHAILARTALYAAGYSLRWDLNTYSEASLKMARRDDATKVKELYTIARDAAKAVIDHGYNSLESSFEGVFRGYHQHQSYNNKESIFILEYTKDQDGTRIGYSMGQYVYKNNPFAAYTVPLNRVVPTFYYSFKEGDTRRDVSICNAYLLADGSYKAATLDSLYMGKWRSTWRSTKTTGSSLYMMNINYPIVRYSDVLLMYAEAENEVSNGVANSPAAVQALKEVRLRAFGNDEAKMKTALGEIPTNHDGFFKAIVQERAWELAFEGYRRTDLIRWNVIADVLSETKTRMQQLYSREGDYANVPQWIDYKVEKGQLQDPIVAIGTKSVANINVAPESGWKRLKLNGFYGQEDKEPFISNFAANFIANKKELLPIPQTTIDTNQGLTGQQTPGF
nr:RagB/SusD family nutrient uptake outer membrane protein [uncultured Bacteroides sp.]